MEKSTILEARKVTKNFGGLIALLDLNLVVREGEITSVIGTNGAGKSTFFNIVTGMFPPTSGTVLFKGEEITGKRPDQIVRCGVARSFQVTNLFANRSVFENVRVSSQAIGGRRGVFSRKFEKGDHRTREVLERLDLYGHKDELAGNLSHGDQRKLEIGIALASNPCLLLLDEPTAGLTPFETEQFVELIGKISRDVTIVLIEHDMKVVMGISHHIVVLNQGVKFAEGTPQSIRANERVQKVYFGGQL